MTSPQDGHLYVESWKPRYEYKSMAQGWKYKKGFRIKLPSASYLAGKNNKFCRWLNRRLYHCQIGDNVKVPKSTYFGHDGVGVLIGEGVILGENVTIYPNTLIGAKDIHNFGKYPVIGDDVKIGYGCIIIGDITIGSKSIIGAGSFVDKNVPENSIVYNKKELVINKKELNRKQKDYIIPVCGKVRY